MEKIQLDLKSRDDIPVVLRGLQAVYCDLRMRKRLFEWLESALGSDRDLGNGRPGMPWWSMLGDSRFGGERYPRQTLIDNVSLLRPELLRAVGERVVSTGHEVVRKESGGGLSARCGSLVVETDVRFPTDLGLLWDATRVAVRVCSKLAKAQGLAGWRQRRHLERQLRHRFQRVCTSRRWKRDPQGVQAYLSGCRQPRQRIAATLDRSAMSSVDLSELRRLVSLGTRLEDQIVRRVLKQWHSFSEFFHSVKDSVLGLGYPLIFYSVSELPVPVILFLAATFRPVFGIAVHRTGPDGAVADTGRSR